MDFAVFIAPGLDEPTLRMSMGASDPRVASRVAVSAEARVPSTYPTPIDVAERPAEVSTDTPSASHNGCADRQLGESKPRSVSSRRSGQRPKQSPGAFSSRRSRGRKGGFAEVALATDAIQAPPTIWNWNQVWSWMEGVESVRPILEPAMILAISERSAHPAPEEIDSLAVLGQEEGS